MGEAYSPNHSAAQLLCPFLITKRTTTQGALSYGPQFSLGERLIDAFDPARRACNRPRRQQSWIHVGLLPPPPQRTELPIFRAMDQIRPQRISLDVTANHQKVIVISNGKALETRLVQVPFAGRMVMSVVSLRVRGCNPTQHPPHQPIFGGPQNHVPMIRHQRKRKQLNGVAFEALTQNAEECVVVFVLVKDRLPGISTIEGMVNRTGFISTLLSGHDCSRQNELFRIRNESSVTDRLSVEKDPRPLFPSPHVRWCGGGCPATGIVTFSLHD